SIKSAVALALLSLYPASAEQPSPSRGPGSGAGLATPAGQLARYIVTDMSSISSAIYHHTATVVSVVNNGPAACDVSIDWFFGHSGSVCTGNYVGLPPGHSAVFCTRTTNPNVTACDHTCSLTFHQGSARVASTNNANCAKIAVAARIYYLDSAE